jgi:hypothetical protein
VSKSAGEMSPTGQETHIVPILVRATGHFVHAEKRFSHQSPAARLWYEAVAEDKHDSLRVALDTTLIIGGGGLTTRESSEYLFDSTDRPRFIQWSARATSGYIALNQDDRLLRQA